MEIRYHVRRWLSDDRGTSFERLALSVAVIAVGFIATADMLDYMSRKHAVAIGSAARDFARAVVPGSDDGIDYSTTGSIRTSRPVILDPCTGQPK